MIKIGVIQFPGSNCERETALAIKRAGMEPVDFLWNENRERLHSFASYVIVGGFSYEDRSRAGIIAALDPLMDALKQEANSGKPILGICNGAQILVESGLVPGIEGDKVGMVLAENKRIQNGKILGTGFYNAWVHLKLTEEYQRNAFTRHINSKTILKVPVANAEGRFVMTEALLNEMQIQGLNIFRYCDEKGNIDENFPVNPNGSLLNIAAIANKKGNVLAIMPHPERTVAGDVIFTSMRDYILADLNPDTVPLSYYPRKGSLKTFADTNRFSFLTELTITDNEAITVQKTLRVLGFDVTVKRYTHWEVDCKNEAEFEVLLKLDVLYNHRKERIIKDEMLTHAYLVRDKEDYKGQEIKQTLVDHYNFKHLNSIRRSVVWSFDAASLDEELKNKLINTNIIYNPYAHECYHYPRSK